ncbi:hypothetical protein R1flu_017970 [Riccia fluitans]|uniref:Uncharacterized protein n=1 Tax=Riccia fluitans TaxID=41844 RepID=A0ABD1ZEQ3_9MARC
MARPDVGHPGVGSTLLHSVLRDPTTVSILPRQLVGACSVPVGQVKDKSTRLPLCDSIKGGEQNKPLMPFSDPRIGLMGYRSPG